MAFSTTMQSLVIQLRESIKVHGSVRTTSGWPNDLTRPYLSEARMHTAALITYLPSNGNRGMKAQENRPLSLLRPDHVASLSRRLRGAQLRYLGPSNLLQKGARPRVLGRVTDKARVWRRSSMMSGLPIELSKHCETEMACLTPTEGERKC